MSKISKMKYKYSEPTGNIGEDNVNLARMYNNYLSKLKPDEPEFIFSLS